ncbi:hypothetical protein BDR04DRAFT_1086925 [Suillus decipiens]|nr:hypothetical protein BDR04DRAFT_1086925 [Suillus decipiens]
MKLTASALVLSFIASTQAATTVSSMVLPTGVPATSGLPFSTISVDTSAASSLSSLYSSESSAVQSVLSSLGTTPPSMTSPSGTGSPAATTSTGAAGRTEAGLGIGLAAGAVAGLLAFLC